MEEIWKDIEGYEGYYQVSNLGRVKSLDRKVTDNKCERIFKGIILRQDIVGSGYLSVMLSKDNKQKRFLVHRLVSETFIPNPCNLPEINHKSEVKTENYVENLEWCDHSYNNTYLNKVERGQKKRKKPVIQISVDGIELCYWFSSADCMKETGFKATGIIKCCKGKSKTHMGYRWRYA